MKLYEISHDMRRALHALEIAEENGDFEAYEAAMAALEKLDISREEKLAGCCAYYRELDARCLALEGEITRLKDRLVKAEKDRDDWREYIARNLGDGNVWENGLFRLSWRKSEAVEIKDEKQIEEFYWREKIVRTVDKKAIAQDIKCGATVTGATLVVRNNLQIK